MKSYLVPVVMVKQTYGHISVMAESMEKAKAVNLTQEQMAYMFQSRHVDDIYFEIENNNIYLNR